MLFICTKHIGVAPCQIKSELTLLSFAKRRYIHMSITIIQFLKFLIKLLQEAISALNQWTTCRLASMINYRSCDCVGRNFRVRSWLKNWTTVQSQMVPVNTIIQWNEGDWSIDGISWVQTRFLFFQIMISCIEKCSSIPLSMHACMLEWVP